MKEELKNYNERAKLVVDKNIDELFKNIKGFDISIPGARIKKKRAANTFKKYLKFIIEYCDYFNPLVFRYKVSHNFYDFYVNLDLNYNNNPIKSAIAKKVLKVSKNIIITGITGSGKSTLMKHLFFSILLSENKYIPFFVELRRVKNVDTLEEYLYKSLGENLPISFKEFTFMLDAGKFIFLFDGTDEKDLYDSMVFMENVLELRDKYSNNVYILTARPNEMFLKWHNFSQLEINQLEKKKTIEIIKKLDLEKEIKNSFIKTVTEKLFESHGSFLSNPLLISVMILTFIEGGSVPLKMNLFFHRAFSTLYYKHDASKKIGYTRLMFSKLDINEFKNVFAFFCFYAYFNKETSFSKNRILDILNYSKDYNKLDFDEKSFFIDLSKSVCLIIKDKLEINSYIFTHIAFKDFFVSYFITNLIKDKEHKKKLINYIFIREGFRYNLIYEILFDEDLPFLENEIIIPILEELKSVTSYESMDILNSFKLFCKFISEKKFNGNKENALDINIDMFLEDLFQKYEKIFSFEEFLIQFIKEKINNANLTTYEYFKDLYEEIIFTDDTPSLVEEKNILPLEIKINTQEFFNKIFNSMDLDNINFSEPEIHSLRRIFLLYFYLMHILEKIKGKYAFQKNFLGKILKPKDY
jgi:energy-coupling factor transporter ATP-binding protein EcfA2